MDGVSTVSCLCFLVRRRYDFLPWSADPERVETGDVERPSCFLGKSAVSQIRVFDELARSLVSRVSRQCVRCFSTFTQLHPGV